MDRVLFDKEAFLYCFALLHAAQSDPKSFSKVRHTDTQHHREKVEKKEGEKIEIRDREAGGDKRQHSRSCCCGSVWIARGAAHSTPSTDEHRGVPRARARPGSKSATRASMRARAEGSSHESQFRFKFEIQIGGLDVAIMGGSLTVRWVPLEFIRLKRESSESGEKFF